MMNEAPADKLYLSDPYKTVHTTRIAEERNENGIRWFRFSETIFYPESGGQASDRGTVNDLPVREVKLADDQVWHRIDNSLPGTAELRLDWKWRYANMQQHSGQHILSACFSTLKGLETVSVHLGTGDTRIELSTADMSAETLDQVETCANGIIRKGIPVRIDWVGRQDLGQISVRRSVKHKGENIRLISIGDFDRTGCGGTHVRNTAEIGLIVITGFEKIRGHVRVIAMTGDQAYAYIRETGRISRDLAARFSCSLHDLTGKISGMAEELRLLRNNHQKLREKWLDKLAMDIPVQNDIGFYEFTDLDGSDLPYISGRWVDRINLPCYFVAPGKTAGTYQFVFRIPEGSTANAAILTGELSARFGIKGGGRPEFTKGIMQPEKWDRHTKNALKQELLRFIKNNRD
jgi:alanyl-tRNA synthetase